MKKLFAVTTAIVLVLALSSFVSAQEPYAGYCDGLIAPPPPVPLPAAGGETVTGGGGDITPLIGEEKPKPKPSPRLVGGLIRIPSNAEVDGGFVEAGLFSLFAESKISKEQYEAAVVALASGKDFLSALPSGIAGSIREKGSLTDAELVKLQSSGEISTGELFISVVGYYAVPFTHADAATGSYLFSQGAVVESFRDLLEEGKITYSQFHELGYTRFSSGVVAPFSSNGAIGARAGGFALYTGQGLPGWARDVVPKGNPGELFAKLSTGEITKAQYDAALNVQRFEALTSTALLEPGKAAVEQLVKDVKSGAVALADAEAELNRLIGRSDSGVVAGLLGGKVAELSGAIGNAKAVEAAAAAAEDARVEAERQAVLAAASAAKAAEDAAEVARINAYLQELQAAEAARAAEVAAAAKAAVYSWEATPATAYDSGYDGGYDSGYWSWEATPAYDSGYDGGYGSVADFVYEPAPAPEPAPAAAAADSGYGSVADFVWEPAPASSYYFELDVPSAPAYDSGYDSGYWDYWWW